MSPSEERFFLRAHRKASSLQPEVQRALLRAFAILRQSLSEDELVALVESGRLDAMLATVFDDATMDRALLPFRTRLREATQSSFRYTMPSLPGAGKIDGVISVAFDHLSPFVLDGIQNLETKAITSLADDIRESVLTTVKQGLIAGKGPRDIARNLRPIIGMSPTQALNAAKYEAGLRAEEIPEATIAKKVAAYQRKAVALNAETNARTATLDAFKLGQQLAWEDAINKGIVERGRLMKTWVGVMDTRERESHREMEGNTVQFDQPYKNYQQIPGEDEYNCRCLSRVFTA